ncbi:MAG: SRPBCC family protein [Syntrophothermus sp.]
MKIFTIKTNQKLPIDIKSAWEFFSSPKNLQTITPEYLSFKMVDDELPDKMYSGTIIVYKIRPLFGIPITWVTEIKHIHEYKFFIDEQVFGPYKMWHHKHFFKEIEGGTEIEDLVHYTMGWSIFGSIAHKLIIRKQLNGIFEFRRKKLIELFGEL